MLKKHFASPATHFALPRGTPLPSGALFRLRKRFASDRGGPGALGECRFAIRIPQLAFRRMFQPRYIKHSHLLIRHAEKLIRYRRDLLPEATIAELEAQIERVKRGDESAATSATHDESEKLDALLTAAHAAAPGRASGARTSK